MSIVPEDNDARKGIPVYSGFMAYFPNAIVAVAKHSKEGNDQHNPGQPLHWAHEKSQEELDSLSRHLVGSVHDQSVEEATAIAWRAMANLERKLTGRCVYTKRLEESDGRQE
jgi:hypothetical protein